MGRRYYDFVVPSEAKRIEKLRYMHRNPVQRGLAGDPSGWRWSSFRHYATDVPGTVEIESEWTAPWREQQVRLPRLERSFLRSHPFRDKTAKRMGQRSWLGAADFSEAEKTTAHRALCACDLVQMRLKSGPFLYAILILHKPW
jgi:hypothetical protein